jgi:hypothetical protein
MLGPLLLTFGVLSAGPVSFTLRIAGDHAQFHPGEVIPIELEFSSSVANRYVLDSATYDRSGRLTLDEYRIEPIDRVGDPLLDMFAGFGGYLGGGIRGMPVLSSKPVIVKQQLNEWFRFDRPGTYRLFAVSRRVTDDTVSGEAGQLRLESNAVTFEIVPSDARWAASAIATAVGLLDSTGPVDDRREGCRILRYLATDAAVDEMVARYDDGRWGCQFDFMAGLFSAANRDRVVQQMEAAIMRGDRAVSASFLQTLGMLSVYLSHPEYRPVQTADTVGRLRPGGEMAGHRDLVDAEVARYRAKLLSSLPAKAGPARAIALADEFASGENEDLRPQLTASFLDLPAERQLPLLQSSWIRLRNEEMLPVLRQLVANEAAASSSLADIALRRLYDLAPDEARPIILHDIAVPRRGMTLKTLAMLPDRELRALDDRLAANVESASGFEDFSIRAELLQRYASAAVASRVLASVRDRLDTLACQPKAALLAYFLRVDPSIGAGLLNRALAVREPTGCYRSVLLDVAKLRVSPELEAAAITHLADSSPQVKANAAEMLGRYGSPAAAGPLRAAFERWHAAWAGRADDLRLRVTQPAPEREQSMVESRVFAALAAGQEWLTTARDIGILRRLCVTDGCQASADGMLAAAEGRDIHVVMLDADTASITIAQYQLDSITDLERKLAQYPAGTSFRLKVWGPRDVQTSVFERIQQSARAHGIVIQ